MSDALGQQVADGHNRRIGELGSLKTTLQNISQYVMPSRQNINKIHSEGTNPLEGTMLEETPVVANDTLHRFLVAELVPPGAVWTKLEPESKEKSKVDENKRWFSAFTDAVISTITKSNFYGPYSQYLKELPSFCTAALVVDRTSQRKPRFTCVPVGYFTFEDDGDYNPSKLSYEREFTLQQAVDKFGAESASMEADMLKKGTANSINNKKKYIHELRMNPTPISKSADSKDRAWQSIWVRAEDFKVMEIKGFSYKPFVVTRWDRSQNETWGWGPGREFLGLFRLNNQMERTIVNGFEKIVDPPILAPNKSARKFDVRAGMPTFFDPNAGGPRGYKPESWLTNSNPKDGLAYQETIKQRIKVIFYNDLAEIIASLEDRDRTATEIAQRVREKVRLFAPTYINITEGLRTIVEAVATMLLEDFFLDPDSSPIEAPPEGLFELDRNGNVKFNYEISFVNRIAIELDTLFLEAFDRFMLRAEVFASIPWNQPPWDNLDMDKLFRDIWYDEGGNPDHIRPEEIVKRMREEAQKQQQAMMGAETAMMASEAAKNLGPEAQKMASQFLAKQAG